MGDRTTTNILLAIIAGVLLFGRDATSDTIKTIAIIGAIGIAAFFVLQIMVAWIGQLRDTWQAKSPVQNIPTLVGWLFVPFVIFFNGYVILLWIDGDRSPYETLIDRPVIGTAWIIFGALLISGAVLGIAYIVWERLSSEFESPKAFFKVATVLFGYSLILPIWAPIKTWQDNLIEGNGAFRALFETIWVAVVGTVLWMVEMLLLAGCTILILRLSGVIHV